MSEQCTVEGDGWQGNEGNGRGDVVPSVSAEGTDPDNLGREAFGKHVLGRMLRNRTGCLGCTIEQEDTAQRT